MDQFSYDKDSRVLTHVPSGATFSNYVGVGKTSVFGKASLYDKLSKVHGSSKAKSILKTSITRGNYLHSKVQNQADSLLPQVGHCLANEVFVYGSIDTNLPDVQGSIDSVYCDNFCRHSIVEIKTKSNYYSWQKYKQQSIGAYYRQIAAYNYLFTETYGKPVYSCYLIVLFANKSEPEIIELDQETLDIYFQQFYNNLKNLSLTL